MSNHPLRNSTRRFMIGAALFLSFQANARAAVTDLAAQPLVTATSSSVLPNILFVLDDSGSMAWTYMPDEAGNFAQNYGYSSTHCNGVYYNPSTTYDPPVDATGANYPNATFTAAWVNGYSPSSGTTNLSTSFRAESGDSASAAYYYNYTGTQTTEALKKYSNTSSTFYRECNSSIGSSPGNAVFTKVVVNTAEQQNFANWYSYYRSRILMMKTAAGRAFKAIDNHYRVGYMSINNNASSSFLNLATFDSTQKTAWYAKLYGAVANNSTPLREALSQAGRLYAGKLSSLYGVTVVDPVQYSCQQNFTILSTDGYWNGNSGFKLDGSTAVGNQDGAEQRPYLDGATTSTTISTSQVQQSQTQISRFTSQSQSRTLQVQTSTSALQKQTTQLQARTSTLQQQTSQLLRSTSQLQKRTSTDYGSTWTGWAGASSCTSDNSGSSRTQCQTITTGPTGVASCTAASANSGNSYTTTTCSTVVTSAYASAASCTASSAPDASGYTTQCQYAPWGSWTGMATCTAAAQSSGPSYTVATARQCQNVVTAAFANASSCTATTTPDSSGNTTQCQYTAWSSWANAPSCSAVAQSASSPYAVATARQCQTTDTGWLAAGSCTPGSGSGTTVTCQTITTGPTLTASCTAQSATSGNSWTQTTCNTTTVQAATGVSSCTAATPSAANNYTGTYCNTVTTGPTAASSCTAAAASATNNWTATTCGATSTSGGTSDTLADVAEYYYMTDLRTPALGNDIGALGVDVADNNVIGSGSDGASWQHMTTFTLGLGARGKMVFDPSYRTASSGDYYSVLTGVAANSSAGICSWQTSGTCNWPTPASNSSANIDDLWHAAVNGRGTYFSATDAATLATGIEGALAGVQALKGGAAAATTSNPNVTAGDNFVFSSTFTSGDWFGELILQTLDTSNGTVSAPPSSLCTSSGTGSWSACQMLDSKTSRTIYTYDASSASHRKDFLWANLTGAEQAYFSLGNLSTLTQFCSVGPNCLSSANQALAAGANLVNYLRGDRTWEGALSDTTKYYRQRLHILGDIVNAEAAYVKSSLYTYADTGYSTFKASNESTSSSPGRAGRVYAAANDGMLHAFNATTGDEVWAYIPSMALSSLYKLADKDYRNLHQYSVDGTPVAGDVYFGGAWHTILVGGMNAGGQGYYALDVTDPGQPPTVLWEYTNATMGYTFGNPVITKLKDGTWVVLVTSGYNNSDGIGRLYVLNAQTGALIRTISTGVGSAGTPSGLAKIAAWADNSMYDNTALRVYGGDMLGNVWRFDINNDIGAAGYDAQLLVTLRDPGGAVQPITVKPELGLCGASPIVFVGTGSYLGMSDLASTQQQSFYAIKDDLGSGALGNPRSVSSGFVQQTETQLSGGCPNGTPASVCTAGQTARTSTANTVTFPTANGWFLDFPTTGERANTDPTLAAGTIAFNTNVPNSSACTIGGYSYQYFLDYCTGGPVATANHVASVRIGNAIATRVVLVKLPNNTIVGLTRLGDGTTLTTQPPIGNSSQQIRRISWRELISDQ